MRTLVMGVGNILLQDEGVGVYAVRRLEEEGAPPGSELLDGGTAGLHLIAYIQDTERLLIVDAIDADAEPGTVFLIPPEVILTGQVRPVSFHDHGILDVLDAARMLFDPPETVIIGVQPADLSPRMGLSERVAAVLPKVVDLARRVAAEPDWKNLDWTLRGRHHA